MNVDLTALLARYAKEALLQIAVRRGLIDTSVIQTYPSNRGPIKGELAQIVARGMQSEKNNRAVLATLPGEDRDVLDLLVARGGVVRTRAFRRGLQRAGLIVPSPASTARDKPYEGSPDRLDSRYFEDVVARLSAAGFVLTDEPGVDQARTGVFYLGVPREILLVPDDILAHLPLVSLKLPPLPHISVSDARDAGPQTFQRDLYLYWRFARHNELTLTTRGLVVKRQLAKIVDSLLVREDLAAVAGEHELGRTLFLRLMLEETALLRRVQVRLVCAPESLAFLGLPLAERLRRCYQAWLATTNWSELLRIPGLSVLAGSGTARTDASGLMPKARAFGTSLLAALPPGQWISLDHFWQHAALTDYDFLLPRDYRGRDYSYYWSQYRERNPYDSSGNAMGLTFENVADDDRGWRTVEGGLLANFVREPLHWLGLVDLGFERGELVAFKITELGTHILRGDPLPASPPKNGQVIVQPNFQVFVFDPIGEHVLASLDRFAALVRADQALEFQLNRESVYRAQQDGMTVAEIVTFLETVSGRALPQNVARTLVEWESHHERIVIRRGVDLLHTVTPQLLDDLYVDNAIAKHLGRRLSAQAAAVTLGERGLRPIVGALLAREHLPAVSTSEENAASAPLTVGEDGRITFQQSLPSIYSWRRVVPLVDERDGAMWLTPESVRRAANLGIAADEIISRLSALHAGVLPQLIVDRIKVWAKHWGDASLDCVRLLRVKDDAALADLIADPAVGPLLHPFVPQGAVALVHRQDVDRLLAVLASKGIDLGDDQ